MAYQHDTYCDGDHSPRQRCNNRLAPMPASDAAAEREQTHVVIEPATPEPFVSEVVRPDPVATTVRETSMPNASPYVSIETARVSSVIEHGYDAADSSPWDELDEERRPSGRAIAVVIIALIAVAWLLLRRRRSDDEDEAEAEQP